MRKFLLFTLLAMLMPVIAYAQNQAVSISAPSSYYSSRTNQRIVATHAAAGLSQEAVASADECQDYSVGLWFKTTSAMSANPGCAILFRWGTGSHANNNGAIQLMQTSTGALTLGFGGDNFGGTGTTSVGTATLNEWHHALVVFENGVGARVYVDGAETASYTSITNFGYKWGDGIFQIGGCGFTGAIDELQFFNKALTAEEANVAYTNPRNLSSLATLYTFDAVADGTTGQFASEAGSVAGEVATLQNATYEAYWESGLITAQTTPEVAPSLTEGREIAATEASVYIMDGEGGTLSATDGTTTYVAADEPYTISTGTTLTLTATPSDGYNLIGIYASDLSGNATEISGNTYVVVSDVVLTARYTTETYTLTVENPLNLDYTITSNGSEVTDLTQILGGGAQYTLSVTVPGTAVLESVMLGEDALTANSDGTYTFMLDADATLTINARNKEQYTVTFEQPQGGTIAVTTGSGTSLADVTSGSTVLEGSVITITAAPEAGYRLESLTVNDTDFTSGSTYTVNGDVTIAAAFVEGIDYCEPVHAYGRTSSTRTDRYLSKMTISEPSGNTLVLQKSSSTDANTFANGAFGSGSRQLYDASSIHSLEAEAGSVITFTGEGEGSWMNTYIFLDTDLNGFDENDTKYNNYTGQSNNYAGTRTITLPSDLAPGTYRGRYIITWNKVDSDHDPCNFGQASDNGDIVFDFDIVVPAQVYENPRNITIASENEAYGSVAFTSPASDEATISTDQKKVEVLATPAEGYVFLNWTNSANEVVATEAAYTYTGEADETLTAHFGHSVTFSFNNEGTMTVTAGGNEVATGDLLPVGTELTFTLAPANAKIITLFSVNGVNCLDQLVDNVYTTTLDANLTVAAEFGDYTATITWEVVGNGTVEAGYEWNENLDGCVDSFNSGDVLAGTTFNLMGGLTFWLRPGKQESGDLYETVQTASYTPVNGGDSYDIITEEGLGEDGGPAGDGVAADGTPAYYYTLSVLPTEDLHYVFAFTQNGQAAIDEIFGDDAEDVPAVYYNLNGVRVDGSNLTPGIYVVKKGSKTAKVIVM